MVYKRANESQRKLYSSLGSKQCESLLIRINHLLDTHGPPTFGFDQNSKKMVFKASNVQFYLTSNNNVNVELCFIANKLLQIAYHILYYLHTPGAVWGNYRKIIKRLLPDFL